MNTLPVRDLDHLRELAIEGVDVFITLGPGGMIRSSKHVAVVSPGFRERFDVFNAIDDTWQTLYPKQLWTKSNIGEALDKGALYAWVF